MSVSGSRLAAGLVSALIASSMLYGSPAGALNLAVEPLYPPERSRQVHEPLINYLREATGLDIQLVTPENFHRYWSQIQTRDDFDLVYDAPHITDFLIQRRDYSPLAKAVNPTQFTLVGGYSLQEPSLDAVLGRSVVTMSAPSMGYMLLMKIFPNPLRQPNITSSAQSWEDAVQIVFDEDADAAMLPSWMAQRYPQLTPIRTTDTYPGKTILASPNVSAEDRQAVKQALLDMAESDYASDISFELNVDGFEEAQPENFRGHMNLLDNLYGFSLTGQ